MGLRPFGGAGAPPGSASAQGPTGLSEFGNLFMGSEHLLYKVPSRSHIREIITIWLDHPAHKTAYWVYSDSELKNNTNSTEYDNSSIRPKIESVTCLEAEGAVYTMYFSIHFPAQWLYFLSPFWQKISSYLN